MMPGAPPPSAMYGELDPLQKLIALLHGFAFSSGMGNPDAAISAPFGQGGAANSAQGFNGGGGGPGGGTGSSGTQFGGFGG